MSGFGDFYNKKTKKLSKEELARRAAKNSGASFGGYVVPQPAVISRGKKDKNLQ